MSARPVFLLTDFGTRDAYAGQMKAVISAIVPDAPIYDITHDVEPFAVDEGAWLLETVIPWLPQDAVVVAVVDPGVGGERRPILLVEWGCVFIGPDNGLLSGVLDRMARQEATDGLTRIECADWGPAAFEIDPDRLRAVRNQKAVPSATFHGRDIFAPAAALVASRRDPRHTATPLDHMHIFPPFEGRPAGDLRLEGEVIHVDRFGNLITTITVKQVRELGKRAHRPLTVQVNGEAAGVPARTFGDVAPGALLWHEDSTGFLAIAANRMSAASLIGAARGAPVIVSGA